MQVEHYTREIQSNPKWKFAGIYADEGISGTNTKKRTDFNRMIEDCMAGKIDMVLTKSVSRFARNTVDCITYIRQLKEKNIAVFFEKENINTLDGAGELLITILGSLAQEESRSLSTNTRWGVVRRFERGQVYLNHTQFLGYTKNPGRGACHRTGRSRNGKIDIQALLRGLQLFEDQEVPGGK
ncbi:Site-specific recombinase [Desulfosporosinus sp. I2]|nr:Site-specific recombinase [Desulfosporosinus sp. I2]